MKEIALVAFTFLFICGCGLVTALAAGVEWGTAAAGMIAGPTLFFAIMVAPMATMFVEPKRG